LGQAREAQYSQKAQEGPLSLTEVQKAQNKPKDPRVGDNIEKKLEILRKMINYESSGDSNRKPRQSQKF
jgi:hypothetical protein